MNILSQRCRSFEYVVTTAGPGAVPLDPETARPEHHITECLFLLIGVEEGDEAVARAAAKLVRRIARKTDTTQIVINGFSHLARPGAQAKAPVAQEVLVSFAGHLSSHGLTVCTMPFGWHKRWTAEVRDGEWEQRVTHLSPTVPAI